MEVVKVTVQALTPEAFAPFGDVIKNFEEAEPEIVKGAFRKKEIPITDDTVQQAHFAYHTDAGQSFYPSRQNRAIFMVGPIAETLPPDDVRAFYSDGSLGIVVKIGVWHTIPISLEGDEIFLSARGDSDYVEHSVEIDFDLERGIVFEADLSTLESL